MGKRPPSPPRPFRASPGGSLLSALSHGHGGRGSGAGPRTNSGSRALPGAGAEGSRRRAGLGPAGAARATAAPSGAPDALYWASHRLLHPERDPPGGLLRRTHSRWPPGWDRAASTQRRRPPRPFGRRRRGDRHRGPFPGPAARRPGSRCSAVRPPPPVTSLKNARRPGGQRGDDEAESAHGGRPRPREARAPLPATLPRLRTAAGPGPSPGLRGSPRLPVHRPRPPAAASPPPRPSQPAPHWRAAVARVSTFRGDLHETLPYWLPPPHVTLAPYAHVENCCCRSDSAPLPAPPPERAVLQPAGAEVTRPGREGPSRPRRRRGGAGSPDAAPPRQDAHPCPPPAGPPGRAGRCRATAQPFPAGTAADGAVKTTG